MPTVPFAFEVFESIVVNELQVLCRAETLSQKFNQASIFLNRQHPPCLLDEQFSQRPETGPDLQDLVGRFQFCRGDNSPQLIGIMEKILAERFRELNIVLRQQLAHFGQFHATSRNTSESSRTALANCCFEITRGGVKPMTFPCSPS